jgi:hypothetical protein
MAQTAPIAPRHVVPDDVSGGARAWSQESYPPAVLLAEHAAQRSQGRYIWTTRADLLLLVGAASLIVFFSLTEDRLWNTDSGVRFLWRVTIPLLLAGSFVAKVLNRRRGYESRWIQARAVAEQTKSLTWRYIAGAVPFGEPRAGDRFESMVERLTDAGSLTPPAGPAGSQGPNQITPAMAGLRAAPVAAIRETYLAARLDDQVDWYARKARRSGELSTRWYRTGLVIKAVALAAAICAVFWLPIAGVVGLCTTLGASALAASRLGRHEDVRRRYAQAERDLAALRDAIAAARTRAELADAVQAAEEVISREHAIWVGRL